MNVLARIAELTPYQAVAAFVVLTAILVFIGIAADAERTRQAEQRSRRRA